MPLNRYLIRNHFNSADPYLYASSDKNDSQALLDGVAVAGLVGLLRLLGDLAQFAAEIFHDLHEEVMVTAAKGHGLMDRIHQLEADIPSIEKNLLSGTNPTAFYYNTGVDWHPQMCMDENLITQGVMPRFIRESYEECRSPPQLFLLDKYDTGGAGSCLKRFTNPSFFNAQLTASEAAELEAQRDWRTRKFNKKGSRWIYGDTPEVLTTSHAKLHQLLREERNGNDSKVPTRQVSLRKRNLDCSRSSKSYMQKLLQTMSPEHSATHEIEVGHGLGSAAEDLIYVSSADFETKPVTSFKYSYDFNRERNKGFTSCLNGSSTERELVVAGENRHGNGVICSSSDDFASASEYYMDAIAAVESEVETDNGYRPTKGNEYRLKKELQFYSMPKHGGNCTSNEHVQKYRDQFSDSLSVDKYNTSDDGSISFMQETSSSSLHGLSPPYDKRGNAMEHGDREGVSCPSTETYEDRDTHLNQILPAVDHTLNVGNNATSDVNSRSDFGEFSDGLNQVMCNAQKTYGSYWADAAATALTGLNVDHVSLLSTKNRDHAVTYSLSGYQDTEGHVGSDNLSRERNPADVNGNSDYNYDYGADGLPTGGYSPSRNRDSSQMSISLSDHQEVESQCSSPISPRYLVDPNSSSEMNKMDEFRRPHDVSFKQYDQVMPLDDNHGNFGGNQVSKRLHPDTIVDSTSWRSRDQSSELINHSLSSLDASSHTHSRINCSFHSTALDKEVNKPHETQTGESSSHTSIHNPGRFPFLADSMPLVEDTIDVHGQPSLLTSEEVKTDSSIIHPGTYLEIAISDTLASARETQSNTDALTMDTIKSGYSTQFPELLLGDTTGCSKDAIQRKPAESTVFPMRKTTQPSVVSHMVEPSLEDTVSEFNAPDVPMHSADQSPEEFKSHSNTEHAAQSTEEKIIKWIEVPGTQIMNEEHCNQEIKSSEREESWSLGLPNHEDENFVEKPVAKMPRQRNLLIKPVDALDRNKLKKVTPRNRPETPNVVSVDAIDRSNLEKLTPRSQPRTPNADGRDSILEVIRTKSFNLKPAPPPAPKPIIRAVTMNLKVSAILEKANRIRQATAGSDEEDDWSDD